jgi:hypothetical protein
MGMKIDGQCHCGAISYEASVDPSQAFVCHCSDCQSISGSPFRWAITVPEDDFVLLSGAPKTYVKIGDSGRESHQLFCPDCASPLYSSPGGDGPNILRLRLGTCRQRAALTPKREAWCRSTQAWVEIVGETAKLERQ